MMVPDGTFVAPFNDEPVMTLTAFTTQSLEVAYLEGFIARPSIDKSLRNPLGKALFDVVFYYLTTKGYKRAMILCQHERLARRYEELGMIRNCGGLISLTKGL
jgi:hypothetical protein